MTRTGLLISLLATLLAATAGVAVEPPDPGARAAGKTGRNAGHEGYGLYQQLCAECHGVQADGAGPRAPQLDPEPPDLTRLRRPDGRPPGREALARVIDGRRTIRAHGGEGMPVWGERLVADLPDFESRERTRAMLVRTLADYVLSIQARD